MRDRGRKVAGREILRKEDVCGMDSINKEYEGG